MPDTDAGNVGALGAITPAMVGHLRETRPWVFLLAVLGFVGSGLYVLFALLFPLIVAFAGDDEEMGLVGAIALSVFYLLCAAIYSYMSLLLLRYASAIQRLTTQGAPSALESALDWQKRFWRLVGILTLAGLALGGILFVVVIVAAVLGALS